MGLIFDIHTAKLYDSWYHSSKGKTMDRFIEELIPAFLSPKRGERVLDIGCGSGNHLLQFNQKGLDISGIDASPYMINLARKRLGQRCDLKTGLAEDMPYEDNEFDHAVLINTLEFLDDPIQVLREAGRVTKRKILIVAMNSFSWDCIFNRFNGLFRKVIYSHARSYNVWELKSCVETALGQAPLKWESARTWFFSKDRGKRSIENSLGLKNLPVGAFIGLGITLFYTMKTDNLPLKIKVGKPKESIAQAMPMRRE